MAINAKNAISAFATGYAIIIDEEVSEIQDAQRATSISVSSAYRGSRVWGLHIHCPTDFRTIHGPIQYFESILRASRLWNAGIIHNGVTFHYE